jgi:glycyl-tRNA synthetase
MEHIYNANGLPFFNEQEIKLRRFFEDQLALEVKRALLAENGAWSFHQIEAPLLTPVDLISKNYTEADVWFQSGETPLVLRPETTPGSYFYARDLLSHQKVRAPLCVWQAGKSFRREDDQPTKHCRFKEFYQQEFQCIFSDTTKNDYQAKIAPQIAAFVQKLLKLPTRLVDSDRLPDYSLRTLDVEVNNGDKWMEVCSISLRNDFTGPKISDNTKNNVTYLVLEIALGLDRLVYNYDPPAHEEPTQNP